MIGVIVTIALGTRYDAEFLRAAAAGSRARFEGLPGLCSKTYMLDPARREARNLYLWQNEEAAREFFTAEFLEHIANVYGATPKLEIIEVAEQVVNS
jgi:hypothetical protein